MHSSDTRVRSHNLLDRKYDASTAVKLSISELISYVKNINLLITGATQTRGPLLHT